jgi:hypothetical protein
MSIDNLKDVVLKKHINLHDRVLYLVDNNKISLEDYIKYCKYPENTPIELENTFYVIGSIPDEIKERCKAINNKFKAKEYIITNYRASHAFDDRRPGHSRIDYNLLMKTLYNPGRITKSIARGQGVDEFRYEFNVFEGKDWWRSVEQEEKGEYLHLITSYNVREYAYTSYIDRASLNENTLIEFFDSDLQQAIDISYHVLRCDLHENNIPDNLKVEYEVKKYSDLNTDLAFLFEDSIAYDYVSNNVKLLESFNGTIMKYLDKYISFSTQVNPYGIKLHFEVTK